MSTRPLEFGAAQGGLSAPEVHLLEPLIFLLLIANVGADGFLIAPDRVDVESPGSEVLPHEIAFALSINPGHVDRALALDETHHLRHRVFRRDR